MDTDDKARKLFEQEKRVLLVCVNYYQGLPILNTEKFFIVFLGTGKFAVEKWTFGALQLAKDAIDQYLGTKRN